MPTAAASATLTHQYPADIDVKAACRKAACKASGVHSVDEQCEEGGC